MKIQILSPKEIKNILKNRLNTTDGLWKKHDTSDTDEENALFFKYYFDLYTAIEATLRGIVDVYSKRKVVGKTISVFVLPDDSKMPYFFDEDKMSQIVNESDVLKNTNQSEFCKYRKYTIALNKASQVYNFTDFSIFKEAYKTSRKARNTLAHGLNAYNTNIDFSLSTLDKLMFVFYILHKYYSRIRK